MASNPQLRKLPSAAWIIAYLISPAAPFVLLRMARAISTIHCVVGVFSALVVHIGLVTVLAETNGNQLQIFITLLAFAMFYLIFGWQYLVGHHVGMWSDSAEKNWRFAARFFGAFLVIALAVNVALFNFAQPSSRLGVPIPVALRAWYQMAGRRDDVSGRQDTLLTPQKIYCADDILHFYVGESRCHELGYQDG